MPGLAPATEPPPPYKFCDAWLTEAPRIDPGWLTLFPGKDGWLLGTGELTGVTKVPDESSLALLQQFVRVLGERGTRLVIVVPPPRGILTAEKVPPEYLQYADSTVDEKRRSYRAALAALSRTGAIVPDILAAVEQGKLSPTAYYRAQDVHWLAEGADLTARAVAAAVEKAVDLSQVPRKEFVTRRIEDDVYGDRTRDAIERICNTRLKHEVAHAYLTEARESGDGDGGLLGDSSQPVALVGTSFSREDRRAYNFDGFLKQHLSMDLVNFAIPGGGLSTSILSYLGSMDFREAPPAILIWELRSHGLPDEPIMRRALATARGACEGEAAVLSGSTELRRGATTLLTLTPEQRRKMSQPLYLDVGVGDTALNKFRLRFEYSDFSREDVAVDLSRATLQSQHYYYALPVERLRKLESVSVRPAARTTGQVSASFCAMQLPPSA